MQTRLGGELRGNLRFHLWVVEELEVVEFGALTALLSLKRLGHMVHAYYGLSPVWFRSCLATWLVWANRLGHMEQA